MNSEGWTEQAAGRRAGDSVNQRFPFASLTSTLYELLGSGGLMSLTVQSIASTRTPPWVTFNNPATSAEEKTTDAPKPVVGAAGTVPVTQVG